MHSDFDDLAFLARSTKRVDILESLSEQPRDLRDLSDHLGIPRTTLSDNLVRFREKGWVRRVCGTYRVTMLGRVVRRITARVRRSMRTARNLSPFLGSIWDADHVVDVTGFDGSTVVCADRPHPYAPVEHFLDALEGARSVRGVTPIVFPDFAAFYRERVLGGSVVLELVVTERVFEALLADVDGREAPSTSATRVRFGIYEGGFDFGLVLLDETVVLVSTTEDGLIDAVVTNDSAGAYEWAESVYAAYRADVRQFLP